MIGFKPAVCCFPGRAPVGCLNGHWWTAGGVTTTTPAHKSMLFHTETRSNSFSGEKSHKYFHPSVETCISTRKYTGNTADLQRHGAVTLPSFVLLREGPRAFPPPARPTQTGDSRQNRTSTPPCVIAVRCKANAQGSPTSREKLARYKRGFSWSSGQPMPMTSRSQTINNRYQYHVPGLHI